MSTVATPPALPSAEKLDALWHELSEAIEHTLDAAHDVFKVACFMGDQTVTFEQIGALLVFAHGAREHADWLTLQADKIEKAVLVDLETIRREGRQVNVPHFDEYGGPYKAERLLATVREKGGADA